MTPSVPPASPAISGPGQGAGASFAIVTTLFFTWGFITSVIDPLIPSVRAIFHLSYAESMLTQFAFFMAYGLVSLPAAGIVARLGPARAIILALGVMLAGCLLMPAATFVDAYAIVLAALFVIAGGITLLQVAANPLAASLGRPERSHFRLTLSQAFNSLGTVAGPYFGSVVMLSGGVFAASQGAATAAQRVRSLRQIDTSFVIVALLIAALTTFIFLVRRRLSTPAEAPGAAQGGVFSALRSAEALFGAGAIFLYVGAEVSVGSMMINFLHQGDVLGVSLAEGGKLLALYWLGAMVGRFGGSLLLTRVKAAWLLASVAAVAAGLCLTVSQTGGPLAAALALSIGLFNAIMFPTIFTLTLARSSAPEAATSGLLCMAIVGGAVLPVGVGLLADALGLHTAFMVPMAAYGLIALFALRAARSEAAPPAAAVEAGH